MKKIAITGHSRGLGAALEKKYLEQGNTVIGFSRSNGYDLRNWDCLQNMLDQCEDCDVFVNSAKPDFVQTTVLYELWKRWQGTHRTIINISTILTYLPSCPEHLGHDIGIDFYRTAKVSLNEASAQLFSKNFLPRIILVKPSHLYSWPINDQDSNNLTRWVETFFAVMQTMEQNNFNLKEISF